MLTYSQKLFNDAVEKVRTMYYNGSTVDEIAASTKMSLIIVEGIIERYVRSKYRKEF
jgi:hypothetical protein